MKKRILDIILTTVITLVGVAIIIVIFKVYSKPSQAKEEGVVVMQVYDQNEEKVIDDRLEYEKGDNLYSLMDKNYKLTIREDAAGCAILGINSYVTDWVNNYFSLYVNGEYSAYGVKQVTLENEMLVEWKWTQL